MFSPTKLKNKINSYSGRGTTKRLHLRHFENQNHKERQSGRV